MSERLDHPCATLSTPGAQVWRSRPFRMEEEAEMIVPQSPDAPSLACLPTSLLAQNILGLLEEQDLARVAGVCNGFR